MINFEHIEKELEAFKKYVVENSKSNLLKAKKKASGRLYDSIDVEQTTSLSLNFIMEEYGEYLDKGVNGKKKKWGAPFSYTNKMPPTKSLDKWLVLKGIAPRDKGKFTDRKQLNYLIRKSIYETGLKTTNFFTEPFETAFKRLPDEVVQAYGLDIESLLKTSIPKLICGTNQL